MKIGIICAMELEARRIRERMDIQEEKLCGGVQLILGNWLGHEIALTVCGVGKVNAAIAAQTMVLAYQPQLVVNTGVAGSVSPELGLLDVVRGEAVVQHDMDTSPLGDPVGFISGERLNRVEIPCRCPSLEGKLAALGDRLPKGVIASGDQFIADAARSQAIARQFGAVAVDMESGSIGQVCYLAGLECLLLRAISDGGDDMEYAAFAEKAAQESVDILEAILT